MPDFLLFFAFCVDASQMLDVVWLHAFGPTKVRKSTRFLSGTTIETQKNINDSKTFDQKVALLTATFFGTGFAPVAPGTFGSAAGVIVFLGLSQLSLALYALTVLAFFAIGVWSADRVEAIFRREDDGRIVIDEVVGQLLTLLPVLCSTRLGSGPVRETWREWAREGWMREGMHEGWGSWQFWLLLFVGFVVFRFFDIVKPGPVRAAERAFSGGLGVMLDDVVAGILGAGVMGLLLWVLGGGLGG